MHYRCVFTLLKWLCARRIGLAWARDVFTIAYHMLMHFHAYIPYILYILIYWLYLVLFCVFLSLPLSLLFTLVALWHLNVNLLRSENPLHSGSSTSSNPTPSSVRFHDDKAQQDFSKNFSRRGVHLERQVILVDFADTNLPPVIHNQGWESLCDVPVTCQSVLK